MEVAEEQQERGNHKSGIERARKGDGGKFEWDRIETGFDLGIELRKKLK